MRPHPAARLLLVYAACLAAMLVTALAVATLRNAPAAEAEAGKVVVTDQPIRATAR